MHHAQLHIYHFNLHPSTSPMRPSTAWALGASDSGQISPPRTVVPSGGQEFQCACSGKHSVPSDSTLVVTICRILAEIQSKFNYDLVEIQLRSGQILSSTISRSRSGWTSSSIVSRSDFGRIMTTNTVVIGGCNSVGFRLKSDRGRPEDYRRRPLRFKRSLNYSSITPTTQATK